MLTTMADVDAAAASCTLSVADKAPVLTTAPDDSQCDSAAERSVIRSTMPEPESADDSPT